MAKKETVRQEAVIRVQISSVENGLEEYSEVSFIRIRSKRYTLLIMRDYMPVIGEIEGDITISCKEREIEKKGIHGYFTHNHNHFSLMVGGTQDVAE
ncbi:hypothetical protein ACTNCH_09870 [Candidatus Merdisoma sp. HCP28S3_D10]|uniref:hypothetical protein n=1 Tax=unclassified Candidatus Merdisoma TaxID=3099611 RepID=UPI003F8A633B